jgi:hypothetical protein
MTAQQLIEELEYAIERNGNQDVEVLMAQQPKWAFEYTIDHIAIEGGHSEPLKHFDLVFDFLEKHFPAK